MSREAYRPQQFRNSPRPHHVEASHSRSADRFRQKNNPLLGPRERDLRPEQRNEQIEKYFYTTRSHILATRLHEIDDRLAGIGGENNPGYIEVKQPTERDFSPEKKNKSPKEIIYPFFTRYSLAASLSLFLLINIVTSRESSNAPLDITVLPFDKVPAMNIDDVANPEATKKAVDFLLSLQPEGTYLKNSANEEKVVPMDVAHFAIVMSKLKGERDGQKDFYLHRAEGAMDWLLARIAKPGEPFGGSFPNEMNYNGFRWGRGEAVGMALRAVYAICQENPEYLYKELSDEKGNRFTVLDTVIWMEQYLASDKMQASNGSIYHRPDYPVSFREENVRMAGGLEDAGKLLLQAAKKNPSQEKYYLLEAKRAFEAAKKVSTALQSDQNGEKIFSDGRQFDPQAEGIWSVSYPDTPSYIVARESIKKLEQAGTITSGGILDEDWRKWRPEQTLALAYAHLIKGDWQSGVIYKEPFPSWKKRKEKELSDFIKSKPDASPVKLWLLGKFVGSDVTIDYGMTNISAGYVDEAQRINKRMLGMQRADGGFSVGYEPFDLPLPLERILQTLPIEHVPVVGKTIDAKIDHVIKEEIPEPAHVAIRVVELQIQLEQAEQKVAEMPPKSEQKTLLEKTGEKLGFVGGKIVQLIRRVDDRVRAEDHKQKKGRVPVSPVNNNIIPLPRRGNMYEDTEQKIA